MISTQSQKQSTSAARQYECQTRRQHFNHLRNTSVSMRNCLAWDTPQPSINPQADGGQNEVTFGKGQKQDLNLPVNQKMKVSFDARQNITHVASKPKTNDATVSSKRVEPTQDQSFNAKQRSKSTKIQARQTKQDNRDAEIRRQIRQKELEIQALKQNQRREKVSSYLQELKPYTRTLSNTKYQDFYDKAAFETYGRVNSKNAIGGIIYGNHQKTFNMNPHVRGNKPKYYQTHYTSILASKRTKLSDDKLDKLQKQLSKKLGLSDRNQTLKQGKELVYVDVDDQTMYTVMKENFRFRKENGEKIRELEKDYNQEIQAEKKAAVQAFYAGKRNRISTGNTVDSHHSSYIADRDLRERLQEQVVYRHNDSEGNVRVGADRHALTCFVDLSFPDNEAVYTQEQRNRLGIYPIQVKEKDKHIEQQRRENYQKSLENIYPSHYLLPNCDQPQILKMVNNNPTKGQKSKTVKSQSMGSTLITTKANNPSLLQGHNK